MLKINILYISLWTDVAYMQHLFQHHITFIKFAVLKGIYVFELNKYIYKGCYILKKIEILIEYKKYLKII